ncbi:hypothetical protein ACA910_012064 [Epithemia clementina (nom. ined.)]
MVQSTRSESLHNALDSLATRLRTTSEPRPRRRRRLDLIEDDQKEPVPRIPDPNKPDPKTPLPKTPLPKLPPEPKGKGSDVEKNALRTAAPTKSPKTVGPTKIAKLASKTDSGKGGKGKGTKGTKSLAPTLSPPPTIGKGDGGSHKAAPQPPTQGSIPFTWAPTAPRSPSYRPSASPTTNEPSLPTIEQRTSESPSTLPPSPPPNSDSSSLEPSMSPTTASPSVPRTYTPHDTSYSTFSPTTSQPSISQLPTASPTTSSPTVVPTIPVDQTEYKEPSDTPSAVPTQSSPPSSRPTQSPKPSTSPRPSLSSQPSANPATVGDNVPFVVEKNGNIIEYSCQMALPSGYSEVEFQRFEVQAKLCPTDSAITKPDLETKADQILSEVIIPGLAQETLDCLFTEANEFLTVLVDTSDTGTLTSINDGSSCLLWVFPFQMDFIVATGGRRLNRNVRQLDVAQEITNDDVAQIVYDALLAVFETTGEVTMAGGFTNRAGTGGSPTVESGGGGSKADGLENSDPDGSSSSHLAIYFMSIGCAVLLVLIVGLLAVRRNRQRAKNLEHPHVLLREFQEDEQQQDQDEGTASSSQMRRDRASISTKAILRHLDPDECFRDEEVSTDSNSTPPQDELSSAATSRYAPIYPKVQNSPVPQNPTFVTADLRKAMEDLQPPPRSPERSRRDYTQSDTVEL